MSNQAMTLVNHSLRLCALMASLGVLAPAVRANAAEERPQEPAPAPGDREAPPQAPPEGEVPKPFIKQPPSVDLDFDLLGKPKQEANPAVERALERRRSMLSLHPALGLATWAALAATVVVGQLDFNDRFRGGGDTGKYHGWHTGLAIGSAALFESTALLALLAPKPLATPARLDTALIHKIAMGTATAGMLAQVVLGLVARGQAGSVSERRIATAHQIIGYGTLAAFTVGTVVFVF